MTVQQGILSIESKNVFTILKKWLYTEQDIVFRELISNASDAIEKLYKLKENQEFNRDLYEGRIDVKVDSINNTIMISDNGIGMTADEVNKYINQIAFSGAAEFIDKYNKDGADAIIGHFGVGFYSSFMLSDHVAIETLSYKNGENPVRWDCNSNMDYDMKTGIRKTPGTDIIIYLERNNPYLKNPETVFQIIKKYFPFLKTSVFYTFIETQESMEEYNKKAEAAGSRKKREIYNQVLVNSDEPIWKRSYSEISDEEMKTFYHKQFNDVSDPLFSIKMESPDIGLRGIIFIRNTKNGTESLDGKFKVYNRGVYIGENIKELIPPFVNLQSGILDCDNLPLVVSRSSIRGEEGKNDIQSLIYETLAQEITLKMHDLYTNHKEKYEEYWPELNAFVKYGILKDKVFASVMSKRVIFKNLREEFQTINEYLEEVESSHRNIIFYSTDPIGQANYIQIFKKSGINVLILDHVIDQPFMRRHEMIHHEVMFVRIDSEITSFFEIEGNDIEKENAMIVEEKVKNALGDRIENYNVKVSKLKLREVSSLITHNEQARRVNDMMEIYGLSTGAIPQKQMQMKSTFLINVNNDMIEYILDCKDEEKNKVIINQLYDLALLSQGNLELEEMADFINRSEEIMKRSLNIIQ